MKTKITVSMTLVMLFMLMSTVVRATIHTVQVANFSFSPSTFSIESGDTIRWIWVSGTHTTTSTSVPAGATAWDHPMTSANPEFDLKLTVVGTYNYHCSIHPTLMSGTITVLSGSGLSDIKTNSFNVKTYPIPFKENLTISFTTPERIATKIYIYDITGKVVKILADMEFEKGNHILNWDGKNEDGDTVNHGIYFYMIECNGISKVSGKIIFGS